MIGDLQILGALAGLLLGIAYGAGKAAFQGILALVTELFLATAGIICEDCNINIYIYIHVYVCMYELEEGMRTVILTHVSRLIPSDKFIMKPQQTFNPNK